MWNSAESAPWRSSSTPKAKLVRGLMLVAGLLVLTWAARSSWAQPEPPAEQNQEPGEAALSVSGQPDRSTPSGSRQPGSEQESEKRGAQAGEADASVRPRRVFQSGAPTTFDEPSAPEATSPGEILGVIIAVLVLLAGTLYAINRWWRTTRMAPAGGKRLTLLDALPIGGRRQVLAVAYRDRVLLLGTTNEEVSLLAEYDHEGAEADAVPDATVYRRARSAAGADDQSTQERFEPGARREGSASAPTAGPAQTAPLEPSAPSDKERRAPRERESLPDSKRDFARWLSRVEAGEEIRP